MAKRLTRSMLALPILGAFVALGVGIAIWHFTAEPEPPKDIDEYLQRELTRLQNADAEDLSESGRNIKAGLSTNAGVNELLTAFGNERVRRFDVFQDSKDARRYEPPKSTGAVDEFKEALDVAQSAEDQLGDFAFLAYTSGKKASVEEGAALRLTEPLIPLLHAVLSDEQIRMPDSGMLESEDFGATWTTRLARMLGIRTAILVERQNWESALETAMVAVRLPGHIHQGDTAIIWLMECVSWGVLLQQCLVAPPWSEVELTELLNNLNLRQFDLAALLRAEAVYADSFRPAPPSEDTIDFVRWHVEELATDSEYPPIEDLIGIEIEALSPAPDTRMAASEWLEANPGDVLDSKYLSRIVAEMPIDEGILWTSYITNWAELVMLRDCARLKLIWLKGKRGEALEAEAKRIADEHGLIEFEFKTGSFTASPNPAHELSKLGHTFEPYTVKLID